MERIRKLFERRVSYEPLEGGSERPDGEQIVHPEQQAGAFSWIDYFAFLLLGVAMLWAWNMFLAAAPYFQKRFESDDRVLRNFQSAELSVSTVANLGSMIVLTKLQARASYPKRIIASLVLNVAVFTLLAISTRIFLGVSAGVYFGFLMVMVFIASLATGLCQNGVFAFVSGFGHEEYTQAIMAGQGVAGVLPCIAQIATVLSVPEKSSQDSGPQDPSSSAFAYFLTASAVSAITLIAFLSLLTRESSKQRLKNTLNPDEDEAGLPLNDGKKSIPLTVLLRKLFWLAGAVALTFTLTMFYPVFTAQIHSVRETTSPARIFQPATFIPMAFLFWNSGDLLGRMLPAIPSLSLTGHPRLLFVLAIARIVFIPLYLLCNLQGKGAKVDSDIFYLFIVQALFGVTNGYLGSNCMMGFVEWVNPDEREAAGGFMSLCLVAGLTAGSLLSFLAAGSG